MIRGIGGREFNRCTRGERRNCYGCSRSCSTAARRDTGAARIILSLIEDCVCRRKAVWNSARAIQGCDFDLSTGTAPSSDVQDLPHYIIRSRPICGDSKNLTDRRGRRQRHRRIAGCWIKGIDYELLCGVARCSSTERDRLAVVKVWTKPIAFWCRCVVSRYR